MKLSQIKQSWTRRPQPWGIGLLVVVLPLITGCGVRARPGQERTDEAFSMTLTAGRSLGQTFVATEAGLEAIELRLQPDTPGPGEIILHLRASPSSAEDLATGSLPLSQIQELGDYRFSFTPQRDSRKAHYSAALEVRGSGGVSVSGAPGATYLDGARYFDDMPTDSQAVFSLVYDGRSKLLGWLGEGVAWLAVLAAGAFLYLVPGWALLTSMWTGFSSEHLLSRAGLSAGLSLALNALIYLWTDQIGLHLGALYAWAPSSIGLAYLLWRLRHSRPTQLIDHLRGWKHSASFWADVTAGCLLILVFGVRFAMIRPLFLPLWGDSVQHAMIAQLILDHGGLFNDWSPYTDLTTFTYHFGFHAAAANFAWVGQLPSYRAVLWVGQILNGLAVLALVPMVMRLSRSHWAAAGTILTAGLITNQPAYYVNWGRYTQLAGQAVLPAAVLLAWSAIAGRKSLDRRLISLAGVAMGGLALVHYRVLIFAVLFVASYLLITVRVPGFGRRLAVAALIGVVGGLLFLPWFAPLTRGRLWEIISLQVTTLPGEVPAFVQSLNEIGNLGDFLHPAVWIVMLIALAWGLWRRNEWAGLIGTWWGLLIVSARPDWVGLPGLGAISSFAVLIAFYMPAGVLIGGLSGWLAEGGLRSWFNPLACLGFVLVGAAGGRALSGTVDNARFAIGTSPDVVAARWVAENTPVDARVLIRAFPAFGDWVIVGVDGGWWLPVLSRRQVSAPPINFNSEQGVRPDFRTWTIDLWQQIMDNGIDDPGVRSELEARGYQYIYLGPQTGPGPDPWGHGLNVEHLLSDPGVSLAYAQDRVWIFRLERNEP